MIDIIEKNEIITRHRNGEGIKTIAKSLGISRNTVRTYVREYDELAKKLELTESQEQIALIQMEMCSKPRSKPHTKKKPKFTPEVERRFLEMIKIAENKDELLGPNKQTLTAALLTRKLKAEGYDIGETTIRKEYRLYMKKYRECYIRQEYEFGMRAEYDFHQIKVLVGGKLTTYHQTTVSCPASNHIYGLLYKNENMNTVMESIIKFINHSSGVFHEMVFDNMSTVVKRFILNHQKQYTEDILKLSDYYGFRIVTCNPRSGNEKGHVENSGKCVRREFFTLRYEFDNEEELMKYYQEQLDEYNKEHSPGWNEEKKHLLEKPVRDYLMCEYNEYTVSPYSIICIDNNFYSVPDKYVGETLTAAVFSDSVIIYDGTLKLCMHKKKKGFKEYSIDINHYINTFLKKPGALRNSTALKQAPETLKRIFYEDYSMDAKKFIEDLKENKLKSSLTTTTESVEAISENQLKQISNIFNQGENNDGRDRAVHS